MTIKAMKVVFWAALCYGLFLIARAWVDSNNTPHTLHNMCAEGDQYACFVELEVEEKCLRGETKYCGAENLPYRTTGRKR